MVASLAVLTPSLSVILRERSDEKSGPFTILLAPLTASAQGDKTKPLRILRAKLFKRTVPRALTDGGQPLGAWLATYVPLMMAPWVVGLCTYPLYSGGMRAVESAYCVSAVSRRRTLFPRFDREDRARPGRRRYHDPRSYVGAAGAFKWWIPAEEGHGTPESPAGVHRFPTPRAGTSRSTSPFPMPASRPASP